jgi:hypothetical protein
MCDVNPIVHMRVCASGNGRLKRRNQKMCGNQTTYDASLPRTTRISEGLKRNRWGISEWLRHNFSVVP